MLTNDDIPAFSAVMSDTPKTETGIPAPQPPKTETGIPAPQPPAAAAANAPAPNGDRAAKPLPAKVPEIGGPEGPEPTRYGDWERKGICVDF